MGKTLPQNQESARLYLESRRWPNGPVCPDCGSGERITHRANGYYRCNACKLDFTVRTGTVMERSHVSFDAWIRAMHLLATGERLTSPRLAKELGVTQKTAWLLLSRLREACVSHDDVDRLHKELNT